MTALLLAILALPGAAVGRAVRGPRPRPVGLAGVVPTAFRYCPECPRMGGVTPHADGSTTCDTCRTLIPSAGA